MLVSRRWIVVFCIDPWIKSRPSLFQLEGRGFDIEKVRPCMALVVLFTSLSFYGLPLLPCIARISSGCPFILALSLTLSASNLERRLFAISINFPFSCFSSISRFRTEQLVVSWVLILWYTQYYVLMPLAVGLYVTTYISLVGVIHVLDIYAPMVILVRARLAVLPCSGGRHGIQLCLFACFSFLLV